jgi:hypothetical protein
MFQRIAAISIAFCALTTFANADVLPLGCYVNKYSKFHLAKHKGQNITSIKMRIEDGKTIENSSVTMFAYFDVTLRGRGQEKWSEGADCGGFELVEDDDGITLINSRGFRVAADGCGENSVTIEPTPGNRRFRLSKAELSACK